MTLSFRFNFLIAVIASFLALPLLAQVPEAPKVPPVIQFANMTLHLTEQAQRDIQADVDALYRSPKYFYMKLERVDMYMPIIEPIFAELGIPDDIKYLVIQESALISDAVSSSNAVGFWQFKAASATEVGMRVDRQIDERINIVASTIGAAKYLHRSNATFDNWLYSIQSYQMGLGGATRALNDRYYGAREMRIDSDTYWYVKKFLSHLVAFRDAIGKQPRSLMLYQYKNTANKDLQSIAEEFDIEQDLLTEYNKWLKTSRIPDDRPYVVLIPVQLEEAPDLLAESQATAPNQKKNQKRQSLEDKLFGEKQKEPELPAAERDKMVIAEVNGIRAVVARPGDNARDLARAGGISVASFLKYNDIKPGDVLKPGQVYYFRKKKRKATVYRHVVAEGESLWDVSQKYGVRLNKLLQKNRMKERDGVKPGQVIWLRYIRPANEPIAFEPVPKPKTEAKEPTGNKVGAAPAAVQEQKVNSMASEQKAKPVQPQPEERKEAERTAVAVEQEVGLKEKPVAIKEEVTIALEPASTNTQEPAGEVAGRPVAYQQVSIRQTIPVLADTPVIKPAAAKLPKPGNEKDTTAAAKSLQHVYPGSDSTKRNVYPQKGENAETSGMQVVERPKKSDPDSFGIQGPVKFIGEDGKPAEVQPKATNTTEKQEQVIVPAREKPSANTSAAQAESQSALSTVPAQDSVHVVQAKETLYSLSRQYGVSVEELRAWNMMGADAVLSIGQVLRLKPLTSSPAASQTSAGPVPLQQSTAAAKQDSRYEYHTVAEGETMYRVARKYDVTIKDIMEWNKKEDFNIKPGEVLIVRRK